MKAKMKVEATRVKAIMCEMKIDAKVMAVRLGVTTASFYNKLSGASNWTLRDIIAIKEMSGHTFDYIFGLAEY